MKLLSCLIIFLASFAMLVLISEIYVAMRKRLNTSMIGVEVLLKLLNRDDYVCIDGKVNQFSHFSNSDEPLNILAFPTDGNKTIGGELAFVNNRGLGYVYFHPSAMINCDFIFGKYGLKWARNKAIANIAKRR